MADRPRVALVAHAVHDRGGMERAFFQLVEHTSDRYRFVVLAAELDERLRPLVEWRRIRVPMRPFPLRFLAFALRAGLELRRVRADLVHVLGAIVPNRAGLATVQFCHAGFVAATGRLAPEDAPRLRRLNTALSRRLALAFERRCYKPGRVRLLGAVSRGVAAELHRHYPGVETVLTPNGVETSRFRPDPEARQELRDRHGVGADDVVALFVGGDWFRKGLGIAIEAVGEAARDGLPLRLWVVGRGDRARFAELARRADAEVAFFEPTAAVERWFAAADLFVLPTSYETFSLVAYEAAASRLPVVAPPVSGIEDLLEGGGAGILVERDPHRVAEALALLARDPEVRRRLGDEGMRRAAGYSWSYATAAVADAYDRLLEASC